MSELAAKNHARFAAARQKIDRPDEPIYHPYGEEQIFARVVQANGGPLDDGAIRQLSERILNGARYLGLGTHIRHET